MKRTHAAQLEARLKKHTAKDSSKESSTQR
jgi:hypothetical protein